MIPSFSLQKTNLSCDMIDKIQLLPTDCINKPFSRSFLHDEHSEILE